MATASLADQLPSVNFQFDELRDAMARFTAKFDAFIEEGRKRVLGERNQYRLNVAELEEDDRIKKKDVEIVQLKTSSHQQALAKEEAETAEMTAAVTSLSSQRERQLAARDELQRQVEAARSEIATKEAAQRAAARQRDAQARFNVPELDFWVSHLCMRIDGVDGRADRLRFVFSHVDERDWARDGWFELDTGGRDFVVRHCRPRLDVDKVAGVVDRANETRELVVLLKGMRELFVEVMRP